MEERFLTGVFVQKPLELAPLVLDRLLHQVRPEAGQGEVSHVHLHQVQHGEYGPRKEGRHRQNQGFRFKCTVEV